MLLVCSYSDKCSLIAHGLADESVKINFSSVKSYKGLYEKVQTSNLLKIFVQAEPICSLGTKDLF